MTFSTGAAVNEPTPCGVTGNGSPSRVRRYGHLVHNSRWKEGDNPNAFLWIGGTQAVFAVLGVSYGFAGPHRFSSFVIAAICAAGAILSVYRYRHGGRDPWQRDRR